MMPFRRRLLGTLLLWLGTLLVSLYIVVVQILPLQQEMGSDAEFWLILALVFIAAFVFAAVIGYRIIKIHIAPIENITETAMELVKGNYRARAYEDSDIGSAPLSSTINVLARNLQEITAVREMEQERLKTLIETMGSGLVMVDRQGKISLSNKYFQNEFGLNADDIIGKFYGELPIPETFTGFIEKVFMTETPAREQLEYQSGINNRVIEVYGAPVIGSHEQWLGIVIVLHDITELKRLEQIRKDFVANVSHELRTPVTSIKGFSETLIDGAYKEEATLLSFLEIIQTETNRLETLIEELLELSRVEQSGFEVDAQPTDMKAVIEYAFEMVHSRFEEKNMKCETFLDEVYVSGDANRLVQIMMNLLVNAITYSAAEKTVTVRLSRKGSQAVVEVEDEGIGIEASEISRLFERFYRVDKDRSRNSGGTGLGLSIVKHLVEAHHGKIEVRSIPGRGSVFTIYLPLAD
ncbi:two-component system histidine kinase PnpS [Planomicrobium sp. MB-3u-38]|uniref:two-component system histidine kinase PnpS n=1 Tax=Planomicrobium sp. MB-3u-38 TaxID=2058318 RepID=UPI000C7DF23F|nr:ATP-binding protein [Planomicrobium sp. MB-3u-38]PKH11417.1 PAS domain-containing sensor histidine kinase [Planomicrobium sp. MB-3u-38]